MDTFTFNKIAGGILSALLVLVASRILVDKMYPGQGTEHGKTVQVTSKPIAPEGQQEAAAKPKEAEKPLPVLLASANVEAGQKTAKVCTACHSWEKGGPNKIGPDLYGVVGRPVASHEGFQYSSALKEKGGDWTFDKLFAFIHSPKTYAPGTKMTFAGLPDAQDRANVIAFLNTQSDKPLPLPKPQEASAGGAPAQSGGAAAPAQGAAPSGAPAQGQAPTAAAPAAKAQ
jgi:cytochrome c